MLASRDGREDRFTASTQSQHAHEGAEGVVGARLEGGSTVTDVRKRPPSGGGGGGGSQASVDRRQA